MYYATLKYDVLHVIRMMDTTLFQAKKIVKRTEGGWSLDINLLFEGMEFSLTEYPIPGLKDSDARDLIPGIDTSSAEIGQTFEDTICIGSEGQFLKVFRYALTEDVPPLLTDVYSGRAWTLRVLDQSGRRDVCSAYLTERFMEPALELVSRMSPCWMELSCCDTTFNDDWTLSFGEPQVVFSNMRDGFAPLNTGEAVAVLSRFSPLNRFSDREDFRGTITRQGNSLVLKVTDQCRRMGVDVGDEVDVTLRRDNPRQNTMMRVFYARKWTPIDDPDSICDRAGCDLDLVRRFLKDFDVIGRVSAGMFILPENPYYMLFDHSLYLKTRSGENIVVSQPYIKGGYKLKDAERWAAENGCVVEEHRDYSWHHPPETTLFVFKLKENPVWRLPRDDPQSRCFGLLDVDENTAKEIMDQYPVAFSELAKK